jgi:putative transposase
MAACAFESGTKFEVEGKRYALIQKVEDRLWQATNIATRRLEEFEDTELLRLYAKGELRFIAEHRQHLSTDRDYIDPDDKRFPMARIRLHYLKAIEGLPSTRSIIGPVIKETWEKIKLPSEAPNPATVLRWRSRYRTASSEIQSLFDRSDRQGNRKSTLHVDVEKIIDDAIDTKYLCRARGTVQDVLDEACARVTRANKLRIESEQLRSPSYWTVRRIVHEISEYDRCVARYGRDEANRRFRGMAGHATAEKPLERVEIDHTPIDLVVADERTGMPLGRPYLTVCIDTFSRCILGIHISFEPPSYLTVSRCLKNAILPKVDLRERYPDIDSEWPAYGLMDRLVVDNGLEFHSESLENACLTLGIEIDYAPRKTPWYKGRVERFFRTLSTDVTHKAPGTTFSNTQEKGDYDPVSEAVVSYQALQGIILKYIADLYHQRPHRALKIAPAAAWHTRMTPEEIRLPDDPGLLDAVLAQSDERRLTNKGIEYDGLFYNSPELQDLRLQNGTKLQVDVRIDRGDLSAIYVLTDERTKYIKVPALDQAYTGGLTQFAHDKNRQFAVARLGKDGHEAWREAKLVIGDMIREQFRLQKGRTRKRMARLLDEALKRGEDVTAGLDAPTTPDASKNQITEQPSTSAINAAEKPAKSAPEAPAPAPAPEPVKVAGRPRKTFQTSYRERSPAADDNAEMTTEGASNVGK